MKIFEYKTSDISFLSRLGKHSTLFQTGEAVLDIS